jgi:integrase/recombinase XerD
MTKITKNHIPYAFIFYHSIKKMRSNGKAPIYGRLTVYGIRKEFSTSIFIEPCSFTGKEIITYNDEDLLFLNQLYEALKTDCNVILEKYVAICKEPSNFINKAVPELKELGTKYFDAQKERENAQQSKLMQTINDKKKLNRRAEKMRSLGSFREISEEYLDKKKHMIDIDFCFKTWKRKEKAVTIVLEFIKIKFNRNDFFVSDMKESFLNDFQQYCKANLNWGQSHFRRTVIILKAILNYAVVSDYSAKNYLAFVKIKRGDKKGGIKHLSVEQLRILLNIELSSHSHNFVRDVFLFQVFTGLSYIDLYNFSMDNIHCKLDGTKYIVVARQKTGVNSILPLLPEAEKIIQKYSDLNHRVDNGIKNPGVLPVYTNQIMNRTLKEIALISNLPRELFTTHTARKTFATLIISNTNISMETVSRMIGHSEQRTTAKFYAQVNSGRIFDEMKGFSFDNILTQN